MLSLDSIEGNKSARVTRLAARDSRTRDDAIFKSRLARTARSINAESSGSRRVVHHGPTAASVVVPAALVCWRYASGTLAVGGWYFGPILGQFAPAATPAEASNTVMSEARFITCLLSR